MVYHHGSVMTPLISTKKARAFLLTMLNMTLGLSLGLAAAHGASTPGAVSADLRQRSLKTLTAALEKQNGWTKVHAAEALLSLDYPHGVAQTFGRELALNGNEPKYRIGIWRILAQASRNDQQREQWLDKIRAALLDPTGQDRIHAAEMLAKLGYKVRGPEAEAFDLVARTGPGPLTANVRWIFANSGQVEDETSLVTLLQSNDPETRFDAAYAIRYLPKLSPGNWNKLAAVARNEPTNSDGRVYLISAAFVQAPLDEKMRCKTELLKYAQHGTKDDKYEACAALAKLGRAEDLPLLTRFLDDNDPDVCVGAAQAILRIDRREPHHLAVLDWMMIVAYGLVVLGVGWYWSRKIVTTEGYLLGGRNMRPWLVGVSLFASLLSTISYLAVPGEMIQNGPMIFCGAVSYPLVLFAAGWFLIPVIMKTKVTSAYEILESRLGVSVRMVGSVIFLAMRLFWMGLIIYTTTYKVLVPVLGLSPTTAPFVCAGLGLITVVYTSMGGLPAVVLTDVINTFILFLGALLALLVITISLGGLRGWWPTEWAPNWQPPEWGYNPTARISFVGVVITSFTWWICTYGSDQMAVQRYLSTRDVRAARRALWIALSTDMLVNLFLAVLGLALLAYFRANPRFMADGQAICRNADQLFPRFILLGLPRGASGLVLVALLAASMSSLSSGINSTCSVVTVDFFERFGKAKKSQANQVRRAKHVVWWIGIVAVLISFLIHGVKGNLVEIAYKVVNFLAAPLFGLFFMALFVRWATALGTIVGAVGGLGVGIAISYWEELTGHKGISFIWAIPLGLIAQVTLGMVASLLTIGRRSNTPLSERTMAGDP